MDGLPEPHASNNDTLFVAQETKKVVAVLNRLEEIPKIENIQRMGKFDERRSRPRTVLLKLGNVWEARKVLSKAQNLKSFSPHKIFISPRLTPEDLAVDRKLLMKHREKINAGTPLNSIRIRKSQLFVDRKLIKIEEPNEVGTPSI